MRSAILAKPAVERPTRVDLVCPAARDLDKLTKAKTIGGLEDVMDIEETLARLSFLEITLWRWKLYSAILTSRNSVLHG
jgi:hypothetical protein